MLLEYINNKIKVRHKYKHFSYILGLENKLQLENLLKPNNTIFAYQDHTYYP
jgi:hypothetical protein